MKRADDFEIRHAHLKNLTDEELFSKFWQLAEEIVQPMLDMGYKYTTPSVERSILLRMGFSSIEAKPIVDNIIKKGLMGKGCGNVIWRLSKAKNIGIREAGLSISEGMYLDELDTLFVKGGAKNV